MLLSAVSVLVVAQSSSEIPEGLMNNLYFKITSCQYSSTVVRNYKSDRTVKGTAVSVKATKVYRQVDEQFHSLLTLAPDGGEWSSTRSDRFNPGTIEQEAW